MAYTTIKKPSDYFNTKLYTGNGSTQSITGVGFQPDWTWIKNRSIVADHKEFDAVRGVTNALITNSTSAEFSQSGLDSFDSDGFTVGSHVGCNGSGNNIVSWNWLASNTTASNTDGSTTSTVSANTTSGFSVGTYTGTGASATIGHGLGTSPSMVIIKRTDAIENWRVHHVGLTGLTYRVTLDADNAEYNETTSGLQSWNSSTFTLGSGGSYNVSGGSFVFYAFSAKQGFSKFGSYIGNGSTDGTFIYTGFKPAFLLLKRTDSAADWFMHDNKRNGFNPDNDYLQSNTDAFETNFDGLIDFTSNGFKIRTTSTAYNASGGTYIYMAFAEEPLVGDNPATAR